MLVTVAARGVEGLAEDGISAAAWQRIKDAYDARVDADPDLRLRLEERLGQG